MHSNTYTFGFAAVVTIVCSVLLASAATLLKPRQVENEKLDKKKNILLSVGIKPQEGKSFSRKEITDIYAQKIIGLVINNQGEVVQGKLPSEIDPKKDTDLLALFEEKEDGTTVAYILPVSGKGLWSTIYGYLALQTDGNTVRGITFYKHGETPGLGGEISKEKFCRQFIGKQIFNDAGELVSIIVAKGKAMGNADKLKHTVDGISGATLTGKGVTNFLKVKLEQYLPFLNKIRTQEGGV